VSPERAGNASRLQLVVQQIAIAFFETLLVRKAKDDGSWTNLKREDPDDDCRSEEYDSLYKPYDPPD
jgi:hypothetical protein